MNNLRLLLVTQDFPPDIGGTQTYAYELARRFAIWCDDFAVIAPCIEGCELTDSKFPFDVFRVKATYDTLAIKTFPEIIRLAKKRKFDATFHVQWPTAIAGLAARTCSSICNVFVAAHGRELLLQPMSSRWLNKRYANLRCAVIKHADGLFPVSSYTKEVLLSQGVDESKISVIPNGVDTARFCPKDATQLKKRLNLSDQAIIFSVCRLVPRKGIDTVIQALPILLKKVPNLVYLIGGSGPDRERLEYMVQEAGIGNHVLFLGRIPDHTLPLYYNLCDVFTMPAHHMPPEVEGFGLVFLEAGACGKPVVGSYVGGIPDAITAGVTGILVPPAAPDALALELERLLTHCDEAAALGKQSQLIIRNQSSWSHRAYEMLSCMQAPKTGLVLRDKSLKPILV